MWSARSSNQCSRQLAAVPTGALSHQSSVRIQTGEVFDRLVHLAVIDGIRTRLPGVVLHRTDLPTSDVVVGRGSA
ncbi:MAG: hypothetical protein V9G12_01600 [Microthrixaceae bacterium]